MTTKLAIRYAKALFDSASKIEQQLLLSNFEELLSIYRKTPKLYSFLNSPEISQEQKGNILKIPFKDKPKFLDFLSLLMQKGRFKYITEIAEEYHIIYTTAYGKSLAHLTTAVSLSEEIKNQLKEKLNKIYHKEFDLSHDVDPEIIGGGVLIMDDRMIDFSIKEKLDRLKNYLQKS